MSLASVIQIGQQTLLQNRLLELVAPAAHSDFRTIRDIDGRAPGFGSEMDEGTGLVVFALNPSKDAAVLNRRGIRDLNQEESSKVRIVCCFSLVGERRTGRAVEEGETGTRGHTKPDPRSVVNDAALF